MQIGEGTARSSRAGGERSQPDDAATGDLVIRIELSPSQGGQCGDRFTLRSTDGAYDQTLVVRSDHAAGEHWVDLVFRGLDRGKSYTLAIAGADGEELGNAFVSQGYGALAGLSGA